MDTAAARLRPAAGAIAQTPVEPRDAARLLVDARRRAAPRATATSATCRRCSARATCVVVNTTRVLPARLRLAEPTGGAVEVLLLEPRRRPTALGGAGATEPQGARRARTFARRRRPRGRGRRRPRRAGAHGRARLPAGRTCSSARPHGVVPLPPYITTPLADPERYQTIYAERGPARSPPRPPACTSRPPLLDAVRLPGARVVPVDLVVGLGTFRPIATEDVEAHACTRSATPSRHDRALRVE